MKIDITLKITQNMIHGAHNNLKRSFSGHLGTHFDVMNKAFPLDYTELDGIVFDVRSVSDRDIETSDIDMTSVQPGTFVAFATEFMAKVPYGSKEYFATHPQLSKDLIDALLDKGVSIIGLDFSGMRNGSEHNPMDQYCADRGVFVVENMSNLLAVVKHGGKCHMHTYPLNYEGMTGLPCRVIADV